jgi:copper(I)-binding protein
MKIVSALLLVVVGCGQEHTGDPIVVRDAWIREPPPRSPAAGYLVIENRGGEPVELVAVATEAAEQTEIHIMEYKDDRMTMRQVAGLQVPAGEEVALKPGGAHLMLMELRQPLRDGDEVELVLRFGDGTERRTQMPVRKKGIYESD